MTGKVFVLQHPLAGTFLKILRDKGTRPEIFRRQISRLGNMLALEATRSLKTREEKCQTPICEAAEKVIYERIALVPILRAGIGLVDPFLDFLPEAEVLFLGMYRCKDTHKPVSYYNKLPAENPVDVAFVIDPMLATGGSAIATIEALRNWGVTVIKLAAIIGAPEGVRAIHGKFPEVDIHLAALDEKLNDHAYIVPGLGDAGDRIFNT